MGHTGSVSWLVVAFGKNKANRKKTMHIRDNVEMRHLTPNGPQMHKCNGAASVVPRMGRFFTDIAVCQHACYTVCQNDPRSVCLQGDGRKAPHQRRERVRHGFQMRLCAQGGSFWQNDPTIHPHPHPLPQPRFSASFFSSAMAEGVMESPPRFVQRTSRGICLATCFAVSITSSSGITWS